MVIFEWFQSFISHSCCGSVVTPRYVVFCAKKARGSGSTHFWWIKAKRRNMETDRKRARERDKVKKRERERKMETLLEPIILYRQYEPCNTNRQQQANTTTSPNILTARAKTMTAKWAHKGRNDRKTGKVKASTAYGLHGFFENRMEEEHTEQQKIGCLFCCCLSKHWLDCRIFQLKNICRKVSVNDDNEVYMGLQRESFKYIEVHW